MRRFFELFGGALTLIGLAGVLLVLVGPASLIEPTPTAVPSAMDVPTSPAVVQPSTPPTVEPVQGTATPAATPAPSLPPRAIPVPRDPVVPPPLLPTPEATQSDTRPNVQEASARPITWLALPRIELETDVVPAQLVSDGDSVTWDIPKFVAGHAESTAGAGENGNAVILGHLVSKTLGNVFQDLDRARVGDKVVIRSGDEEFDYTVTDVSNVDRTDVDILDPTSTPTITLITCAGLWNPVLHDYMERLVVRGQLTLPNGD